MIVRKQGSHLQYDCQEIGYLSAVGLSGNSVVIWSMVVICSMVCQEIGQSSAVGLSRESWQSSAVGLSGYLMNFYFIFNIILFQVPTSEGAGATGQGRILFRQYMDQTLLVIHLRGLWFICDPQIVAPNGDQSIYKELHHYESVAHTVHIWKAGGP